MQVAEPEAPNAQNPTHSQTPAARGERSSGVGRHGVEDASDSPLQQAPPGGCLEEPLLSLSPLLSRTPPHIHHCSPTRTLIHTHTFLPDPAVLGALNLSQTKTGKSLILLPSSLKLLIQTVPQIISPPLLPPGRLSMSCYAVRVRREVRRFGGLEPAGSGALRGGRSLVSRPPPAAKSGSREGLVVARGSLLA